MYPAPVFVVGSYDAASKANFATASFGGICCSQPPCVAVSLRKATATYQNLLKRKAFTLAIPSRAHIKEVDYLGLVSGRTTDKVATTKLTVQKSKVVDAPFLKEFPVVLECTVIDITEIGMHTQFIGEVQDVKAEQDVLDDSGTVSLKKLDPMIYTPDTQEYYSVGELAGKVFSEGKEIV